MTQKIGVAGDGLPKKLFPQEAGLDKLDLETIFVFFLTLWFFSKLKF